LSGKTKDPNSGAAIEIRLEYDRVMAALTPREQHLLRVHLGPDLDNARTLEELERRFQATRRRIEEIDDRALLQLRRPPR
jgi:DNA-directed RNA polymerase sigma subunit (sigma70/sigma32)